MFRKNRKTDKQADKSKDLDRNAANRDKAEGESPKLEKGDVSAMLIAAIGVFLPVVILVTVFLIGILWILFIR